MRRTISCILAAALAACAHEPPPVQEMAVPQGYTATPVGGVSFAGGADVPAQWWTLFRSPALDALVRQALANSPTQARAQARLRQAEAELEARTGATQHPRVDAKLSANRVDVQPESLGLTQLPVPMPLNLYLASVSVSYTFDFFGATRNELDALRAEVEHQRFEGEAARLMLAGNVVTTAIRAAALREQLADSDAIIALQERQLAIAERLEQIGTLAQGDLAAQRRDLAQARAGLPELRRQLEQARHRLAIYTGTPPGAAEIAPLRLADLQAPAELPLSLPAQLTRQRPDVRAAEAVLQAASARVGVATAQLYPQVTLSANFGSLAARGSDLFGGGTGFYLLGASLAQPLFRGGELQARRRAAIAAYEQAGAAWQETVLQGWREVADVMRALEADAEKVRRRDEALKEAQRLQEIAADRYRAGGISNHALLDAQRRLHAAQLDRTQAIADRHADAAALLHALGGGWWH